ncbi:MAG: tetratricopeptide repeat protein [Cyanobacteria bacterium P01_C01_bin.72]
MAKKNKKETKSKKISRIVTLVLGLGFAGSTLAIALSSAFSQQNHHNAAANYPDAPTLEEQIQQQIDGYKKVLEREPKNITALEGLTQIYLQTDPPQAILTLEKLVEYYPEQQQYAGILEAVKERQANSPTEPETSSEQPE